MSAIGGNIANLNHIYTQKLLEYFKANNAVTPETGIKLDVAEIRNHTGLEIDIANLTKKHPFLIKTAENKYYFNDELYQKTRTKSVKWPLVAIIFLISLITIVSYLATR